MLKISKTQKYSLLKVAKFPRYLKMMRSTRINWFRGHSITATVLIRSPVGTIVTQNQNFMIMMSYLRLGNMFFAQELMVDATRIEDL